jgi:hypothetical protein
MDWKFFNLKDKATNDNCYYDFVPYFVEEKGYLPIECRECHKVLIFWNYSKPNITRFNKMLKELPLLKQGKYNEGVVVFYLQSYETLQSFLVELKSAMQQFNVEGKIEWQVSGAYWRRRYPQFFLSAKQLRPIHTEDEVSITQWLSQNDKMSKLIAKIADDNATR